jgi:hypothetical protein
MKCKDEVGPSVALKNAMGSTGLPFDRLSDPQKCGENAARFR